MGMMPKVSIIIPVFNGENFLMQAVNSALNQTHKNIAIKNIPKNYWLNILQ